MIVFWGVYNCYKVENYISEVGVRYTDKEGKEEEKYFLEENQGKVYKKGKGWFGTLEEVANQIDPLIDKCMEPDMWDDKKTVLNTEKICKELMKNKDFER